METMAEAAGQNPISMRALLEAGVHFGHNTGRWNPKMKQYIFGARNGIHIIDLQHTVKLFRQAFQAVVDTTSRGDTILFVGTKKQAQDVIVEEATRSNQHYVTQRWLGGTLTNFRTVKGSLERLRGLEKMEEDGTLFALTKREQVMIKRDRDKLMKSLGGIKGLSKVPGMLFVIDPHKEHIAVDEARKLEIRSSRSPIPTAIRTRSTTSSRATTTRSARSSCSRRRSPTQRSWATRSGRRPRATVVRSARRPASA
jgi:small subunit ribosomal protein S2